MKGELFNIEEAPRPAPQLHWLVYLWLVALTACSIWLLAVVMLLLVFVGVEFCAAHDEMCEW